MSDGAFWLAFDLILFGLIAGGVVELVMTVCAWRRARRQAHEFRRKSE